MSSTLDDLLERVLGVAAALLLFALMSLTCVDVVGRYFFNRPVLGAFELTEMALALLIFIGLPLVTLRQEHISVDLFDAITPRWLLRVQHIVAHALGTLATGYLAWRLWLRAMGMLSSGETTAQLKIALGYLCAAMALLTALTAVAFLIVMLRPPRENSVGGDI